MESNRAKLIVTVTMIVNMKMTMIRFNFTHPSIGG